MKIGEVHPHPVSFPNYSIVLCDSSLPLDEPTQCLNSDDGDPREVVGPTDSRSFTDHDSVVTTSQFSCKGT